jgi:hypothetical protein
MLGGVLVEVLEWPKHLFVLSTLWDSVPSMKIILANLYGYNHILMKHFRSLLNFMRYFKSIGDGFLLD